MHPLLSCESSVVFLCQYNPLAHYGGILVQTQNQKKNTRTPFQKTQNQKKNAHTISKNTKPKEKHAHTISKSTKPKEKRAHHFKTRARHFKKTQNHFQTAFQTFVEMVLCFLKWCACVSTKAMHPISKAPSDPIFTPHHFAAISRMMLCLLPQYMCRGPPLV